MKLRPYHNPENVDESKVPDGWCFPYQPLSLRVKVCRLWWPENGGADGDWVDEIPFAELDEHFTYIVLVNA